MVAALETVIAGLDNPAPTAGPGAATAPVRQQRVTDTEAHTVWKRAAELQALTGIQQRPPAIPGTRDENRSRFGGMAVSDVREAAVEAGIDSTYVEHALVEIGLTPPGMAPARPSPAPATPAVREIPVDPAAWFSVVRQFDVDGEVAAGDLERLINVLRDETGKMGRTEAKSRELVWWTGWFGRRLDVSMVPSNGRSRFRLSRSLARSTVVTVIGCIATLGFGSTAIGVAVGLEGFNSEALATLFGISSGLAVSYYSSRTVLRFLRRRTANRLRVLGDKLANKVRDHAVREEPVRRPRPGE